MELLDFWGIDWLIETVYWDFWDCVSFSLQFICYNGSLLNQFCLCVKAPCVSKHLVSCFSNDINKLSHDSGLLLSRDGSSKKKRERCFVLWWCSWFFDFWWLSFCVPPVWFLGFKLYWSMEPLTNSRASRKLCPAWWPLPFTRRTRLLRKYLWRSQTTTTTTQKRRTIDWLIEYSVVSCLVVCFSTLKSQEAKKQPTVLVQRYLVAL